MKLSAEYTYATSCETLMGLLADEEFVRWRALRTLGHGTLDAADVVPGESGSFTVLVRRTFPTDFIPPQVRAFVGSTIHMRQAEVWASTTPGAAERHGTVAQEIVGAPARVVGTVTLTPSGTGECTMAYSGDIVVTLPFFTAAIEEAASTRIRAALDAESEATRAWLAGER
ncbi:MAG: DUF2505 domain-containing protein [Cellulomonadaceae bacterium]|nr:DUF2505 domain-containing protein [Cellulomonadaceae bacterium]